MHDATQASAPTPVPATAPRLSLAVLPFVSLAESPGEDRLAAAITDDLATELARLPGARVIAHRTAATYRDRPHDIRQIGQELGVRYLVEGSVRMLDKVLRVNAKLISAETNTHVWAARFDEPADDGKFGQDSIIGRLRAALSLQLLKAESACAMQERPDKPDALDLLFRAWPAWGNTASLESLAEAGMLFEQALQLDPSLVPAMCGLAYVLIDRYKIPGSSAWADESLVERAADLLAAAAAVEPDNERLLYCQGFLLSTQARFAEACAALQRVAELLPNEYPVYRAWGLSLIANGQPEQAVPVLERAIRVDPVSPTNRFMYLWAGYALLLLQRDGAALPFLRKALIGGVVASPAWQHRCFLYAASAHAQLGQLQEARHARPRPIGFGRSPPCEAWHRRSAAHAAGPRRASGCRSSTSSKDCGSPACATTRARGPTSASRRATDCASICSASRRPACPARRRFPQRSWRSW
jgi:TolB-like protein